LGLEAEKGGGRSEVALGRHRLGRKEGLLLIGRKSLTCHLFPRLRKGAPLNKQGDANEAESGEPDLFGRRKMTLPNTTKRRI